MKPVSVQDAYRGSVVPVLTAIVVLSLAAIAFLFLSGPPRLQRVDPRTTLLVEAACLSLTGVVIPVLLLLNRRIRSEPRLLVCAACVAALMTHAAALGEPVRAPGQDIMSTLAAAFSALFCFVALLAVMERLDAEPQRGGPRRS